MNYPGDTADPKDVARWMASVAENEFGLPGILPVMTSCVELTAAWTGPGDVKDVPGYLEAQDYDSLGYFQQRPSQGWGSSEELIDANYALRAFCKVAVDVWRYVDPDDVYALGEWCQDVQRSTYPDAYAEKGYPIAVALLAGTEEENATEYPEHKIEFDEGGWAKDPETGAYLRSDPNLTLYTNASGWLWGKPARSEPASGCEWPVADVEPDPNSWNYQERHPTRYYWRSDVEAWACYLVKNYDVWCNTYYEHPEGYGFWVASTDEDGTVWYVENTSVDIWGPADRNDPIDSDLGQQLFEMLFNDQGKPDIRWIIWWNTIYGAWNGWQGEYFGDGTEFTAHRDHIHVTYW